MISEAERQRRARELAFRLAWTNPPCVGRAQWWTAIEAAHATARTAAAAAAAAAPAPAADPVAEIQKYKLLFDAGVLTEEEFAAKKKQLLGI